jgi:hypothetical protein
MRRPIGERSAIARMGRFAESAMNSDLSKPSSSTALLVCLQVGYYE